MQAKKKSDAMAKVVVGLVVFLLITLGVVYLAGVFTLLFLKMPPRAAGLTTWFAYWSAYGDTLAYGKRIRLALVVGAVVGYGVPLLAAGIALAGRRAARELHGSARFATLGEVRKSGLMGAEGILIGKYRGRFLAFAGAQFVALLAPTRSGKGVGCVIPNLLNWPESVIVQDVKLENWELTAGFRKKYGQLCYLFNPFAEDGRTARYNPLDYVRADDALLRVGDLMAIGESFFPSDVAQESEKFFNAQARNLFVGLGLFLFETPDLPRTIGEMLRQSSGKGKELSTHMEESITARNYVCNEEGERVGMRQWSPGDAGLPPLSVDCVSALERFIGITGNTQSSVLASFNAPLGIWQSPIVDAATSASDFDLREVRKKRMSIYIGITPDHLADAQQLLNLFWSQMINQNTKELPQQNSTLKYTCLLLMDEFTAPGRIAILAKAVSYMAGYGLRLLTIAQSVSQLQDDKLYGREGARTLMTNHAVQILYTPKEQQDAEEYSKILGYETMKAKGKTYGGKGGPSKSESDQRRALMMPQELRELGQDKEIIIGENMKPIMAEKIRYYEDPAFSPRLLPAPEIPALDLDLFLAKKENRVREASNEDVNLDGTVDLSKFVLDVHALPRFDATVDAGEGLSGNEARFVADVFGQFMAEADAALRAAVRAEAEDGAVADGEASGGGNEDYDEYIEGMPGNGMEDGMEYEMLYGGAEEAGDGVEENAGE